jgi:predicted DCC family thiol-disulfide oxidoreductase YuxK
MSEPVRYPLTIFYDNSCPMCASEMHALKARAGAGQLDLVDCSAPEFDAEGLRGEGIRRSDLMGLIHARDARGRWFVGVDVFKIAYAAAGFDAMARFWGSRRLGPWLRRIYPWVARHRQVLSRVGFNRLVRLLLAIPSR